MYDNPNKVQEAEDRLLAIKQDPSESIAVYIAKFERILYEAHGQEWPDVTKISTFRKGLISTIRNRLSQQLNLLSTYTDFLRVVQQLAGQSFNAPATSAPRGSNSSHERNPDAMDLNTIQINAISDQTNPISYRDTGRCYRCGSTDHWVRDCRLPKGPLSSLNGQLWNQRMLTALETRKDNGSESSFG